jgi:hypothetical protein
MLWMEDDSAESERMTAYQITVLKLHELFDTLVLVDEVVVGDNAAPILGGLVEGWDKRGAC